MNARLEVNLLPGWEDISYENPDGLPTFIRSGDDATGVLQMSIQALHESGAEPNPTYGELIRLSEHVANVHEAAISQRYGGDCDIGKFGCVIGNSAELTEIRIWTISNGGDFILATFLCIEQPSPLETEQAESIVKTVRIVK